jgi:hypothetical protein
VFPYRLQYLIYDAVVLSFGTLNNLFIKPLFTWGSTTMRVHLFFSSFFAVFGVAVLHDSRLSFVLLGAWQVYLVH